MNEILWQALVAAACFAFSTVFSASETALLSLSRPRLKKLISQRPSLARAFTSWLSAPQYLLTTILIGNTLANVVAAILATNVAVACLPHLRRGWVETGAWLAMTLLLFVFGEFIPKSFARHYPQRVALFTLRPISLLAQALTPGLKRFLGFFEKLPMFEGVPVGRLSVYSVEELGEIIRASAAGGQVERRSSQMMERTLALERRTVSQIMTPFEKVESVNLGLDPEQVIDQVAEAGRTRVPAYRADPRKIGGYLHVKDLLLAWRGVLPLRLDLLLRQPLFIAPAKSAAELLEEFRTGVSHLAVIVDAQGACQGIVTLEDVLEEVLGEILDEYDLENPRGVH